MNGRLLSEDSTRLMRGAVNWYGAGQINEAHDTLNELPTGDVPDALTLALMVVDRLRRLQLANELRAER